MQRESTEGATFHQLGDKFAFLRMVIQDLGLDILYSYRIMFNEIYKFHQVGDFVGVFCLIYSTVLSPFSPAAPKTAFAVETQDLLPNKEI